MLEGHGHAQERSLERLAWLATRLLIPYSEHPLSVDELMGREAKTEEQDQAEFEEKRQAARALLQKIETAQVRRRDTISIKDI